MLHFLLTYRKIKLSFQTPGIENFIEQRIDHFTSTNLQTYRQRYWSNEDFGDERDPKIIVYLGGESELVNRSVLDSVQYRIASETGSYLYGLEHRFYGKSYPFDKLTSDTLKYLSVEQGMADIASFIDSKRKEKCGGKACPVLVIGGSYIGTVSSWFRMKYPHYANFSWASSPPLLIKNDFSEYDRHVATVIKQKSETCFINAQKITQYAEDIVYHHESREQEFEEFMKKMGFQKEHDNASLMSIVADFFAGIVQYEASSHLLTTFCSHQQGEEIDLEAFYEDFNETNDYFGSMPDDQDDLLISLPMNSTDGSADHVSWLWQTCTEFGWFQSADENGLRSKYVNLDYSKKVCNSIFGLSHLADEDEINFRYNSVHPDTTNTIYTNGMVDPWSTLSLINGTDLSAQRYTYYIEGASHCSDLHLETPSDSADLKIKRKEIIDIITEWIGGSCEKKCVHGDCYHHKCICHPDFRGEFCETKVVDSAVYRTFSAIAVCLPTILMITIGLAAWFLFRKDRDFHEIHTLN